MTARESNFELLRILAMFMVLVIHANFVCLPRPLADDLAVTPIATVFRYLIGSLGIVCIDVFVLISGWFRIKTDVRRVFKFVFQILFFWFGGYLICMLFGIAELSWNGILECFAFTRWDWFIKAYAVLFILAPVLNAFVDQATEKQLRNVVIAFFLFQSTFGWIGGGRRFFVNGYGPLSFIGLYLLAQYARSSAEKGRKTLFDFPKQVDLLIFFITAVLNTSLALFFLKSHQSYYHLVYAYCNPVVIVGSLYLFLFFSKLKMRPSRIVNWIGASSFAVYLLHSQINIREVFTRIVVHLDTAFHGFFAMGMVLLFLILTYIVSILLDQIRIRLWNLIWNHLGGANVQANY